MTFHARWSCRILEQALAIHEIKKWELIDKPGSVSTLARRDGHFSGTIIAHRLKQPTREY